MKGFRLLPRKKDFYDFFCRAAENARVAAQSLVRMANNLYDSEEIANEIRQLEHEGDTITHECIQTLNKASLTPIDRDDIYRLACALDDIIDYIEAVSERLWLYKLTGKNPSLIDLVTTLEETTNDVVEALYWLNDPRKKNDISKTLEHIHTLENRGDEVLRRALATLFDGNPDPLQVIKWKEIYENAEIAIDKCETVATLIEGIHLKQG